jgi:hypothetical protein
MILGSWLMFGCYAASSALLKPSLPEALRTYLDGRVMPSWQVWIGGVVLLLSIWNAIELFRFKRRAKVWYLGLVAAGFALVPWLPPTVESQWAAACMFIQSMLAGGLIVAMFWSPVADRFEKVAGAA